MGDGGGQPKRNVGGDPAKGTGCRALTLDRATGVVASFGPLGCSPLTSVSEFSGVTLRAWRNENHTLVMHFGKREFVLRTGDIPEVATLICELNIARQRLTRSAPVELHVDPPDPKIVRRATKQRERRSHRFSLIVDDVAIEDVQIVTTLLLEAVLLVLVAVWFVPLIRNARRLEPDGPSSPKRTSQRQTGHVSDERDETETQPLMPRLAAGAVIRDDAGRILLVKRGREPSKGRWSVPGGKSMAGETLAQTAAREAREETGLTVEIGAELWRVCVPDGASGEFEIHDFAAQIVSGELDAADDADEVRWVDPQELAAMALTDGLAELLDGLAPE